MSHKERLSKANWYIAHSNGARRPSLDPHSSLPKGPSLLARKYLATHLGGPFVEEQIHGLLQEDPLSKAALLKAKQLADSKLK